jgi:hypothetical protein
MTRPTGKVARRTRFRPARPDEAERLTAIAVAAKAHWGYGKAFMARFAEVIALTPAEIRDNDVWVVERAGQVIGFYGLVHHGDVAELDMVPRTVISPRSWLRRSSTFSRGSDRHARPAPAAGRRHVT